MTIELSDDAKVRILNSDHVFAIMREVLAREDQIDQDREHFWVIGLASNHRLLFIELITMGTVNKALVEPMEVYSLALQKRAVKIMLVHNHPSGDVRPSEADKDITDRLYQVGLILNTPVLDHLIITPTTFMSFADTGLLDELAKSGKYVPRYKQIEKLKQIAEELGLQKGLKKGIEIGREKGWEEGKEEGVEEGAASSRYDIAKRLKEKGVSNEIIADTTGLAMAVIKKIKVEM